MAGATLIAALGYFYLAGAFEHSRVVNWFKAQGDQSAYLAEAKLIYDNWRGVNRPPILQPRNRMPVYPAFLATLYDPQWSDPEFFEHAKIHSIWLSLVLLVVLAAVSFRHLPTLPAANFMLIVAFGYYVFKAGYTQSELLFYTLQFLTFVAVWHLLEAQTLPAGAIHAVLGGALAALAHLTKAAMLPFAAVLLVVYAGTGVVQLIRTMKIGTFAWRLAVCLTFAFTFLLVLYPYIANSKRAHGQYFYNLNTSALIWYDNYTQAGAAIQSYGPDGWPPGRRSMRPGPMKYWREHTAQQIADRFLVGARDMLVRSYQTFWYLKFVVIYIGVTLVLVISEWTAFLGLVRRHGALMIFLLLYAVIYGLATAFYEPTSGTGTTRFLLAHVAPFVFVFLRFAATPPFRDHRWTLAGVEITPTHLHLLVLATIGLDLTFTLWPRLMTTYGGF